MPDRSPFKHAHADDSPGFLLWKLTALWQEELAGVLAPFGITQTQYAIVASLRWFEEQGEPPTQTHLAAHTKIEKMTLSKAIRKLEEDGHVARAISAADGRATEVRFTAKGRRLVERAVVAIERADDEFFGGLAAPDLQRYKALTRALVAHNAGSELRARDTRAGK
jgi:DNA-binding MarR family transcriptional regulator